MEGVDWIHVTEGGGHWSTLVRKGTNLGGNKLEESFVL